LPRAAYRASPGGPVLANRPRRSHDACDFRGCIDRDDGVRRRHSNITWKISLRTGMARQHEVEYRREKLALRNIASAERKRRGCNHRSQPKDQEGSLPGLSTRKHINASAVWAISRAPGGTSTPLASTGRRQWAMGLGCAAVVARAFSNPTSADASASAAQSPAAKNDAAENAIVSNTYCTTFDLSLPSGHCARLPRG